MLAYMANEDGRKAMNRVSLVSLKEKCYLQTEAFHMPALNKVMKR